MKLTKIIIALGLSLSVMACKPSAEREQTRYTQSKDRLEALGTKNPTMKADIQAKLAEFEKAKQEADGKSGEAKAQALAALNGRIDAYEKTIAPAAPAAVDAGPVLGSKLGMAGSGSGSAGSGAPAGSASKLGGGTVDAGVAVDAAAGKLGGGSGAAPSKSGFGATPDAPAATPKSGFGGK